MSDPTMAQKTSRIAIQLGASSTPSSGSTPRGKQTAPSSSLGKRLRSEALNADSDSEVDDPQAVTVETVTSFGDRGAETEPTRHAAKVARTGPSGLVIKSQANRNWKAETLARRSGAQRLPHEFQAQHQEGLVKDVGLVEQVEEVKWGLTVTKEAGVKTEASQAAVIRSGQSVTMERDEAHDSDAVDAVVGNTDPDKDALDALLGISKDSKRKLVIAGSASGLSEQDALERDYSVVGNVSTIEEYDEIPDGEFGAAMLRGMGWDGKAKSTEPKKVERRAHQLGLGAKEDAEIKKAEISQRHGYRERRPGPSEYRRRRGRGDQESDARSSALHANERDRTGEVWRREDPNNRRGGDGRRGRDRDGHGHRDRDS